MHIRGGLLVGWLCLCTLAACDRLGIGKDDVGKDTVPSAVSAEAAGKLPTSAVECEAYCDKQILCFPGAGKDNPRWLRHCHADCQRDVIKNGPVGTFIRAAASCSTTTCGDPYGTCIAKRLDTLVSDADEGKHEYLGLPQQCLQSHACFLAQQSNPVEAETREQTLVKLIPVRNEMYRHLRASNVESTTISCRMELDSKGCGVPTTIVSQGPAIELDCDAYCAKQKVCYPKGSAADTWGVNCRDACEAEARAGTSVAAFFAAIAACHQAPCGEKLGACISEKVNTLWPKGRASGWDMRGLHSACMLFRACTEVGLHASTADAARLTREATYGAYDKVFSQLKRDGGDSDKHCTTMASYIECK
jgi:hypothetical protein